MRMADITTSTWAIMPGALDHIHDVLRAHLRGPKLNLKDMEARVLSYESADERGYRVVNGSAIISVMGPTAKRVDIFDRVLFGMVSTEMVKGELLAALEDDDVSKIVLHLDTPGGSTDGVQDLASAIYNSRGRKPIVAFSDGIMASAGVWYGSAADKIYVSGDTVRVGSIGIIGKHVEGYIVDSNDGVRVTEIAAGKSKNTLSQNAPLTQAGWEQMKEMADHLYDIFVNDVAKFRGRSPEDVRENMAEGRLFFGLQAIEVGLVDGVSSLDDIVSGTTEPGAAKGGRSKFKAQEADMPITKEQLIKESPELYQAILDEGRAQAKPSDADLEARYAQGKADETERVKSIRSCVLPGHEALIEALILDGKSTASDAAMAVLKAEGELKAQAAKEFSEGAPSPVPTAEAPQPSDGGLREKAEKFVAEVEDVMKKANVSKAKAMAVVAKTNPDIHQAWIDYRNEGR